MKILIIEDSSADLDGVKSACLSAAEVNKIDDVVFVNCPTLSEASEILQRPDFRFDLVISDIGLPHGNLNLRGISDLMSQDLLGEAKFVVHTGNSEYYTSTARILETLHHGAHNFVIKGTVGQSSLKNQLIRLMRQIRQEATWSMIGRFCPEWKRKEFADLSLWGRLKDGIRTNKAILWCDLATSTDFVQHQRRLARDDKIIVEFFRRFFTQHSQIIEQQQFGGIIDKFIGDEILAYFSGDHATRANEQCENAINAALAVRDHYVKWYPEVMKTLPLSQPHAEVQPNLRILVHYGEVTWGVLGSDSFSSLTCMTTTMVKGKRILSHYNRIKSKETRVIAPGEICITDDVYKQIDCDKYQFQNRRCAQNVRSFGDIDIYPVTGHASERSSTRSRRVTRADGYQPVIRN